MKTLIATLLLIATAVLNGSRLPQELRRAGVKMRPAISPLQKEAQAHSAVFYNASNSTNFIYGTVVSEDGLILTKLSELDEVETFTVRVGRQHYRKPKVLAKDYQWDLALVKISAEGLEPVDWGTSEDLERGTWVVVNGGTRRTQRRVRLGVISASIREVKGPILVLMGVQLRPDKDADNKLRIQQVTKGSGAELAGLEKEDLVLELDDQPVSKHDELVAVLETKVPGDHVRVKVQRGEEELIKEVELKGSYTFQRGPRDRNEAMSGQEVSPRRFGFPRVMQHDVFVSRARMGGPVFTLDGKCVGVNIASVNRAESFAIPAEDAQKVLADLKKKVSLSPQEE